MPLSEQIQKLIHHLEVGAVPRYLRFLVLGLAVLGLVFLYNLRAYRNLATPEAMDTAQLARNLAEGKGYSTLFIRPFSLYLVQTNTFLKYTQIPGNTNLDFARIQTGPHPDIANPPVYPVVLAGLMKVLPFRYEVELKKPFWSVNGHFWRYQPDFQIALFNELLLLVVVGFTFLIARRLFDTSVAWVSALLLLGCELLWRFSVSGLSTLCLMVIFLGLTWIVLRLEELAREPWPRLSRQLGWALAAGGLTGVGALTRYAFGWTILPLAAFLVLAGGKRRGWCLAAAAGAFVVVLLPWAARNYAVSGTLFGTAGFAVAEGSAFFPQFVLERSVHPDLASAVWFKPYLAKLVGNAAGMVTNDLPRLGSSWASLLFLAGLLLGFRGQAVRRMRYFLLLCLGTFIVIQALGRTQLSEASPEVNTENLIVLLIPLIFSYGVSFFFTFLDQMRLPVTQLRYFIVAAFAVVSCLPLISTLISPRTSPLVYPPYYPPDIQRAAGWMRENELMMSDVPWAVAWYGHRQCVWLTLNTREDFEAINTWIKPVAALYLTTETMDGKFISDMVRSGENGWGSFVTQAVLQNQIPQSFPLRHAPAGSAAISSGLFLTDRERWHITP